MSNINNIKVSNCLALKPNAEYDQLAKIRERQRRERKEKLYSYPSSLKRRNNLP
jgi:hypothetical protein